MSEQVASLHAQQSGAHTLPAPRHEPQDVTPRFLLIGAGGLVAVCAALATLAAALYPRTGTIGATPASLVTPAQPALQSSPRIDMAALRREQRAWLDGAGWVDRAAGVAHLPIARAMHAVVAEGLPGWPR